MCPIALPHPRFVFKCHHQINFCFVQNHTNKIIIIIIIKWWHSHQPKLCVYGANEQMLACCDAKLGKPAKHQYANIASVGMSLHKCWYLAQSLVSRLYIWLCNVSSEYKPVCFYEYALFGCWRPRRQLVKGHLRCQMCWVTDSVSSVNGKEISHPSRPQAPPPFLHPPLNMSLVVVPSIWRSPVYQDWSCQLSHEYLIMCLCVCVCVCVYACAYMHTQPKGWPKQANCLSLYLNMFYNPSIHAIFLALYSKESFVVSRELLVRHDVMEQRPPWWWWTAGRASRWSN